MRPMNFQRKIFLEDNQQLNLEKAFSELNRGMEMLAKKIKDSNKAVQLQKLLDDSLAAYRRGDDVKGAHILQEFQIKAFK